MLLQVKELKTYFINRQSVFKAVDGISFDLAKGKMLGIVGESGSGKSISALSLLRLVGGSSKEITSGQVIYDNVNLMQLGNNEIRQFRGKEIAMIPQEPMSSLNPVLSIGLQICEMLEVHLGLKRHLALRRSEELLQSVGIPDACQKLKSYPHELSGGMRQRVMIAIALSCNPKIIIADEPTTALDVTTQAQILQLLRKLTTQYGVAVILITHNLGVLARYVDTIMVMYAGRIVEKAGVRDLYARPSHPYTVGLLTSVPRVDVEISGKLISIEGRPPNLNDLPTGCSFAPRCSHVTPKCRQLAPELRSITSEHSIACWVNINDK
jgi:oligopeptide transport system ATP-binding protein